MLIIRRSLGYASRLIEDFNVRFVVKTVQRSQQAQKNIDKKTAKFVLYELKNCPDCSKLRLKLHQAQIKIERKNAEKYECYRNEVLRGGGIPEFPCLAIKLENGKKRWVYGSKEIKQTLNQLEEIA